MYDPKASERKPVQRSAPKWRWLAFFLIGVNLIYLGIALSATFRANLWTDSNPLSNFTILTIAAASVQITPFARSIWVGTKAISFDDIDEFERAVSHRIMIKSYQSTAVAMMAVLLCLWIGEDIADIRLNGVSGGYWLMWFALLFFSLPAIFAGLEPRPETDKDEDN